MGKFVDVDVEAGSILRFADRRAKQLENTNHVNPMSFFSFPPFYLLYRLCVQGTHGQIEPCVYTP